MMRRKPQIVTYTRNRENSHVEADCPCDLRRADGNTTVNIAMTVSPNTTYRFYLKCVRQLGDITTSDEGIGLAVFTFPTNSAGGTFAFDMYPEGAPLGNKFQSAIVSF
jgi:hypothetical protein